jgi:hypothetical protein
MSAVSCAVCDDTGLLGSAWCPLCDGFGCEDWLGMQHAQSDTHKGRLLVRRLMRVSQAIIEPAERECIEQLLVSSKNRRKKIDVACGRAY